MTYSQTKASDRVRDTEICICEAYNCSAPATVFLFTGMPETKSIVHGLCDECFGRMKVR